MVAFDTAVGRTYYYNEALGKSVWERPTEGARPPGGSSSASPSSAQSERGAGDVPDVLWPGSTDAVSGFEMFTRADAPGEAEELPDVGLLPPGWLALTAPNGRIYFYNEELGRTDWKRPT